MYHIRAAYTWYRHLLDNHEDRKPVYALRGFGRPVIPSSDWEVFASILLENKSDGIRCGCSDLRDYEVKSSVVGNPFVYHYYRISGIEKWEREQSIQHLLISYGDDYRELQARLLPVDLAARLVKPFGSAIMSAFSNGNGKRQDLRQSITYQQALNAPLVFHVKNGELTEESKFFTKLHYFEKRSMV